MVPDFDEAYEAHVWRVYGFFAYRVGSRADAEDLTQLTFERALRAWGRYDPNRASLATWLGAIARNLLIDHVRGRDRRGTESLEVAAETPDTAPGPEETVLGLAPELERALATLTAREREAIGLRFGAELTGPEISKLLGLSLANVQQILSRSLRKLRAQLEGQQVASEAEPAELDAEHGDLEAERTELEGERADA